MKRLLLSIAFIASFATSFAQKTLVLYFSETGTTKTVAQELQKQLNADIESIEAVQPYSGNFQETIQRSQQEDSQIRHHLPRLSYLVWNLRYAYCNPCQRI